MVPNRKRIVRTLVILGVVLIILVATHLLVNSVDLPGVLRSLHGG
jgi:hypothetical protein